MTHVITASLKNEFTNHVAFMDVLFRINRNSNVQLQSERYIFGNTGTDKVYYFLDVEWKYTIKPNKFTISMVGKNLLDTNQFKVAAITDVSVLTTEYNLLPRYVLLKGEYRF